MAKLDRKIALITGGNSGIGLASAKLFAAEGATVVIAGRRQDALDAALSEVGSSAIGIRCDVANLDDLDRLYAEIGKRYGRLDIVFANAAIMTVAPIAAVTPEHFDREFGVNVRGLYFTVQKSLPLLPDGSSIILTSSVAHFKATPGFQLYGAAKAAVRSFARGWTTDLKDRKIRVNCLSPGPTETPLSGKMGVSLEQVMQGRPNLLARIPLGRMGAPAEVASAALFLASDDSSFITGIDLCVDGGLGQV
ncbi:oxidoreductase [Bradyrhizobium sp. LTSPM299]|uniref:glucose 1-dehydrogenase n=1 Tax=Bradyrhizobium sp. LTSPM299 TaxID=1619233 RepID=UPI0005CB621E|nr:glucose 1-dehydrogenase [Bradyrhizobium sp. LTSPM299]KJC55920.1 oxidoreductase [Bradyrhizobium sp. LTSPM299]